MTRLFLVQALCQQVAEIIASVLDAEVQIIDEDLTTIAGTGIYKQMIGMKDAEASFKESPYLYTRILRSAQSFIVENPMDTPSYGPTTQGETAEICAPIKLEDKVIGIISLLALDKEQRYRLLSKKKDLLTFLQQMAFLISSRIVAEEAHDELIVGKNKLDTLLEAVNLGVIGADGYGVVTNLNKAAELLLDVSRDDWIGKKLELLWPKCPLVDLINGGTECTNREVPFTSDEVTVPLLASTKAFVIDDEIDGGMMSLTSLLEARTLAYDLLNTDREMEFDLIKGKSKAIEDVKSVAFRVAKGTSTVLIRGETGTGKELFAAAIHYASPRRNNPFVVVNCAAIPDTLLESELFGYEEGAFTGAKKGGRAGKFEIANGGTLFLDEIGDLPLHLQPKLLHALQRQEIERVGGNKPIAIDVRIVAATNRDLEEMCASGEYREDLYYRLSVIPLFIPPLRERRDDVEALLYHFLHKYNKLLNRNIVGIEQDAEQILINYHWPGNVRELQNVIEYAVNMEPGIWITTGSIPRQLLSRMQSNRYTKPDDLREHVNKSEDELLLEYDQKTMTGELTKKEAAQLLGISRSTFYRKLARAKRGS